MVPPLDLNNIKIAKVGSNSFDIVSTSNALMNSSQLMTLDFYGNAYIDTTNVACEVDSNQHNRFSACI